MFPVKVEAYPQTKLAGISVRTDMQKASADCMALWQKFMPMLKEMPKVSYGISVAVAPDKGIFDYWAAAPGVAQNGMREITIAPSTYAKCTVPALKDLQAAYKYMYTEWPQTVKEWQLDYSVPCFEFYDERFGKTGEFDLYIPVKAK